MECHQWQTRRRNRVLGGSSTLGTAAGCGGACGLASGRVQERGPPCPEAWSPSSWASVAILGFWAGPRKMNRSPGGGRGGASLCGERRSSVQSSWSWASAHGCSREVEPPFDFRLGFLQPPFPEEKGGQGWLAPPASSLPQPAKFRLNMPGRCLQMTEVLQREEGTVDLPSASPKLASWTPVELVPAQVQTAGLSAEASREYWQCQLRVGLLGLGCSGSWGACSWLSDYRVLSPLVDRGWWCSPVIGVRMPGQGLRPFRALPYTSLPQAAGSCATSVPRPGPEEAKYARPLAAEGDVDKKTSKCILRSCILKICCDFKKILITFYFYLPCHI